MCIVNNNKYFNIYKEKYIRLLIILENRKVNHMKIHMICMDRKLREISGSLVVTIPKQVCDLYGFKNGDMLSIEPIGVGELRLRKI